MVVWALWLHFMVMGNHEMVAYLIEQGADVHATGEVATTGGLRSFTAMEIAKAKARSDAVREFRLTDSADKQRIRVPPVPPAESLNRAFIGTEEQGAGSVTWRCR